MDKSRAIFFIILFSALLLLTGCVKSIEEVKSQDYVDKKVTVKGTVEGTLKIGTFSGYSLKDDSGQIGVVSADLPEDGSKKTVSGTLKLLPIVNVYYIDTN